VATAALAENPALFGLIIHSPVAVIRSPARRRLLPLSRRHDVFVRACRRIAFLGKNVIHF